MSWPTRSSSGSASSLRSPVRTLSSCGAHRSTPSAPCPLRRKRAPFLPTPIPPNARNSSTGCSRILFTRTIGRTSGPTCCPNSDRVGVKSVYVLDQWLRESFRENKPYDQFVREIVLTEGNTHRFGPAVIYRDRREPAEFTTMFSRLFLGVRMDCAKCHHHPNEKWSQDDFYH